MEDDVRSLFFGLPHLPWRLHSTVKRPFRIGQQEFFLLFDSELNTEVWLKLERGASVRVARLDRQNIYFDPGYDPCGRPNLSTCSYRSIEHRSVPKYAVLGNWVFYGSSATARATKMALTIDLDRNARPHCVFLPPNLEEGKMFVVMRNCAAIMLCGSDILFYFHMDVWRAFFHEGGAPFVVVPYDEPVQQYLPLQWYLQAKHAYYVIRSVILCQEIPPPSPPAVEELREVWVDEDAPPQRMRFVPFPSLQRLVANHLKPLARQLDPYHRAIWEDCKLK